MMKKEDRTTNARQLMSFGTTGNIADIDGAEANGRLLIFLPRLCSNRETEPVDVRNFVSNRVTTRQSIIFRHYNHTGLVTSENCFAAGGSTCPPTIKVHSRGLGSMAKKFPGRQTYFMRSRYLDLQFFCSGCRNNPISRC